MVNFKKYVVEAKGEFITVTCADCDRPLLNLVKTAESDEIQTLKVYCVRKDCAPDNRRGESWVHELQGKYIYSTIKERDYIESMEQDEDEMMHIHLAKKKTTKEKKDW